MVHHTVQEKHQDKLKTTIIQFIMLTYFLSVIMKDPVVVEIIQNLYTDTAAADGSGTLHPKIPRLPHCRNRSDSEIA